MVEPAPTSPNYATAELWLSGAGFDTDTSSNRKWDVVVLVLIEGSPCPRALKGGARPDQTGLLTDLIGLTPRAIHRRPALGGNVRPLAIILAHPRIGFDGRSRPSSASGDAAGPAFDRFPSATVE